MLERRAAEDLGTTTFAGAASRHHFCYGLYQSAERLNWGNLRVLNQIRLERGAARSPNFLGDMDVVILAQTGAVAVQCDGRTVRLGPGGVAFLSMGAGGDYGIANVGGSEAALIEIWFSLPDVGGQRYPATIATAADRADLDAWRSQGGAGVRLLSLVEGEQRDWRPEGECGYVAVLDGSARIAGLSCGVGDAVALHGEDRVAIDADGRCDLLIIDTPGSPPVAPDA